MDQPVSEKQKPSRSTTQRITSFIGDMGSLVGAAILKMRLSKHFAEPTSKWAENRMLPGFLLDMLSDTPEITRPPRLLKIFDPKQWRSNIAFWGTLVGGIALTQHAVSAMSPKKPAPDNALPVDATVPVAKASAKTVSWQTRVEPHQDPAQQIVQR